MDAYVKVDLQGRIIEYNTSYRKLTGYKHEEIIKLTYNDLTPKRWHQNESEIINKQVLVNGYSDVYEKEYIKKDGTIFPVELRAFLIKDENNNPTSMWAIVRDISERKQFEKDLKERETRLEKETNILNQLIDLNPYSIQICDKEGYTLKTNKAHFDLFAAKPPPDYSIFDDPFLKEYGFQDKLINLKSGKAQVFPIFYYNANRISPDFEDKGVWVRMVVFPIMDDNNQLDKIVLMHEDVTERELAIKELKKKQEQLLEQNEEYEQLNLQMKKTNEELQLAKDKAEESDQLKTAFLQNISHEIRTPMNAIFGFTDMLSEKGLNEQTRNNYIKIIKNSCEQLLSIIDDLINISSIETGKIELTENEININDLLIELYTIYKPKALSGNVSLFVEKLNINDTIIIKTDIYKLKQIIINLLNNAIKFTQSGSIDFGCKIKGKFLEFYVKDTGIGIDEKYHTKIFERFHKIEDKKTISKSGTGLGLSISKALVDLLGGNIWFNSELHKGTTFYFTIPLQSKAIANNTSKNNSGNILIVEDIDLNYLLLDEMIRKLNYTTLHARNGKDVFNLLDKHSNIKLILLDLKMPVMDGFEVLKKMKELKIGIPVIVQSAYNNDIEKKKAFELGCKDYLVKPIHKENLKTLINKFLKQ